MTLASATDAGSPLWYATRATGMVALLLLTADVVLGIMTAVRFATRRWPRLINLGVHRNVSMLVMVFLILHIATAELDTYAPVGWLAVVVPFMSAYRPIWLGLGTVAFDLLLAVTITSLLRTRVPARLWRLVHWAAYACWPVAVIHSLGTGSDASQRLSLALLIVCVGSVLAAVGCRLVHGWPEHAPARVALGTLSVAVTIAAVVWAATGPLDTGWSSQAGTPKATASSDRL